MDRLRRTLTHSCKPKVRLYANTHGPSKQEKHNSQRKPANRTTTTRTVGTGTRARTEGQVAQGQNLTERNGTDRADRPGLRSGRVKDGRRNKNHGTEQPEQTRQDQGQDQDQDGRTNGTGTYRRNGTERVDRPGPEQETRIREPNRRPKPFRARCVPQATSGEVRAPRHFWQGACPKPFLARCIKIVQNTIKKNNHKHIHTR